MIDLCKETAPPNPNDRAYFPHDTDLRNHIFMAKRALQLSCLDQENVALQIDKWKVTDPESKHFFRPFLEETVERDLNRKRSQNLQQKKMEISKEMMVWMILPQ